nr:immunoglobulin light chain junction region [Macaca mulatta]
DYHCAAWDNSLGSPLF